MLRDETMEGERRETVYELSDLFIVVQEMGRRLANETHGNAYSQVRQFNELLHQARIELNRIKDGIAEDNPRSTPNPQKRIANRL